MVSLSSKYWRWVIKFFTGQWGRHKLTTNCLSQWKKRQWNRLLCLYKYSYSLKEFNSSQWNNRCLSVFAIGMIIQGFTSANKNITKKEKICGFNCICEGHSFLIFNLNWFFFLQIMNISCGNWKFLSPMIG